MSRASAEASRRRRGVEPASAAVRSLSPVEMQWLAGLLEGEGCFGVYWRGPYIYPMIALSMTDRDVVERAATLLGTKVSSKSPDRRGNKPMWRCAVSGDRSIRWMADLHEHMGERRRGKIESVLREWSEYQPPVRRSTTWRKHEEVIP